MRRQLIVCSLALVICAACATPGGAPKAPEPTPAADARAAAPEEAPVAAGKVAHVEVVPDPELKEDEHRDQWVKHAAGPRLQEQVVRALESRGRFEPTGDVSLRILVTDFRLRPGGREHDRGTTYWWGYPEGSESYTVHVEVEQAGAVVRSFDAAASDSAMGTWNISPDERSERVIQKLADRIASDL
jgi:hypothetical protein